MLALKKSGKVDNSSDVQHVSSVSHYSVCVKFEFNDTLLHAKKNDTEQGTSAAYITKYILRYSYLSYLFYHQN